MNKTELQKQINEIDDTIKELQEKQNKLKELVNQPENVRRRADNYGEYFTVAYNGTVIKRIDDYNYAHTYNYSIGNYFKTEQEAQDYKENLITKQKLKDLALRLNNGVEIDWKNSSQKKWFIYYDFPSETIKSIHDTDFQDIGNVFCLDINFLDIAKQEIGEQALIKLIKSGV